MYSGIINDVSEEAASSMFNVDPLLFWWRFLRNKANDIPDYMAKHPRRE
jgi:hypothetical protein